MACYAYDGEMRGSSDTAEERSYMENEDIKQCFNVKHMVDYAWRPVTDSKLLSFLGGVAHKREVGSLLRMVMLSSLIGPRPSEVVNQLTNPRIIPENLYCSQKRNMVDCGKSKGHEKWSDKPCHLEEEAEVLVTLFLPEKASYKVESLSELVS